SVATAEPANTTTTAVTRRLATTILSQLNSSYFTTKCRFPSLLSYPQGAGQQIEGPGGRNGLDCAHSSPSPSSCDWQRGHFSGMARWDSIARVQRGPSEGARCASRRPLLPPDHHTTPSNAASPFPHSTHHSCPQPPPPLWPSPHTFPPGGRQNVVPARPAKSQICADF